jgi:hypothetical protein
MRCYKGVHYKVPILIIFLVISMYVSFIFIIKNSNCSFVICIIYAVLPFELS